MSKPVKDRITNEYRARYGEMASGCLVNVIGLDAISTHRLRSELRQKSIRLQVIKNSIARRAFSDTSLAPLANALEGPCALVTGGQSMIDVAKMLVDLRKSYPKLELKVGLLDGDTDLIDVENLAKMKSRTEMLGEVAMMIVSPARRLAGCLAGPGGRIAGCLKAMGNREEEAAAA